MRTTNKDRKGTREGREGVDPLPPGADAGGSADPARRSRDRRSAEEAHAVAAAMGIAAEPALAISVADGGPDAARAPRVAGDPLAALVARAAAGSAAAFEELLAPHLDRLQLRLELRLAPALRAQVEASDLLQDVLVEAYRSLPRLAYRGEAAFGGWLRVIADRVLAGAAARLGADKRGASRTEALASGSAGPCAALPSPSSLAQRREQAKAIRDAVARLPEPYRQVLVHRICDDLSVAETALRMARSEGSVRMLTLRALERLQRECGL